MAHTFLDFFRARSINVAVGQGAIPNGQLVAQYEVTLARDDRTDSFTITGSPEAEHALTPEDAARALHIRANMFEAKAALSNDSETLCRETAGKLLELLGTTAYHDFIALQEEDRTGSVLKSLFARFRREKTPDYHPADNILESFASTR